MKKLSLLSILFLSAKLLAQLPPAAQALYNEFASIPSQSAQVCINAGATASATADGKTFYMKWFPSGATPSLTPLMVGLHGSGGNAFLMMAKHLQSAQSQSVGMICLQWYLGSSSSAPNDYFGDTTLYTYIDTALKRIKYPKNKALYHGFSRGSARSYAIQFLDVYPGVGKNYFCTIMSNAGKPDSAYPFFQAVNSPTNTNHSFCKGKKWAMFCGGLDPNPGRDGCPGMNSAKTNWVQANGGSVGLFIQDPNLAHTGFVDTPTYIDSLFKFYKPCFQSGVQGLNENHSEHEFKIFPNPVQDHLNLSTKNLKGETLTIYDCLGVLRKQIKIESAETKIDLSEFQKGIYFIELGKSRAKFVRD
ncbi:MAG: T9SS type A sorting domain-containing protein [Sphingobacteriaceae bacterium]|nr:T9SS type A sorting domain-containing protein [Sphingobacteriaceae bacterium]